MNKTTWEHNDGGRKAAGFKGSTGDCVTRAIAIATGLPYREVYDELFERNRGFMNTSRTRRARKLRARGKGATPRSGVYKEAYKPYLEDTLGWAWTPTMQFGQGCKVHLTADELPSGTIIARCSKHLVAVIDGVAMDTNDPTRNGTRCVYGYWSKPEGDNK